MKRLVLILLCAVMGNALLAQSRFGYGPKVALNLSSVNLDDLKAVSVDNKMRVGMAFGGFATYQVNDWMGLQAEVMYSIQGAKLKFPTDAGKVNGKLVANYINVPILAKFYPIDGMHIHLGPEVNFLVRKKLERDNTKLEAEFHNVDFCIAVGVGYEFPFGMAIDLRYNIGMVDILKKVDGEKIRSKNGVIQLGVGWRF
jgi:hypothetical protein